MGTSIASRAIVTSCVAIGLLLAPTVHRAAQAVESPADFEARLAALPVVDEIDAAQTPPSHQFPPDASRVEQLLGRDARRLPVTDRPGVMAWVIGRNLVPGAAYVLEVEYPDDVPRAIFIANRGADQMRGFATGAATGDARRQYTQPSLESLAYPQTGKWQTYRSVFFLHERFQDLYAQRDSKPGGRPRKPADGFHVIVFQTKHLDDPRSQGAAIGKIRLRRIDDVAALYPDFDRLPDGLPQRHVFYREEMADETISARQPQDRGVTNPVDWYVAKARLNRLLGIDTFTKDLLEFGFNQGWDSGDPNWVMNAQPPLTRVWEELIPRIAGEGLAILPYYEYKGAIGQREAKPQSLGWQRRAGKLYHGRPNEKYTDVWWTEDHNADLTDPDTLADAKRLLDRTLLTRASQARFLGAWFRVRDNHLPMSFADAALDRFRATDSGDPAVQNVSQDTLIASYEGDRILYHRYVDWWLARRVAFFAALRDHLAASLKNDRTALLFTPWTTEQIPLLRDFSSAPGTAPVQIVSDDPAWWNDFAKALPSSTWYRWALVAQSPEQVLRSHDYRLSLEFREPIGPLPGRNEHYHSAPVADPAHYREQTTMLSYPAGRLFTAADADLLANYRTRGGLTAIHHYTLNEDDHDRTKGPSDLPFDGQLGYISVDVDRAGPMIRLLEARLIAAADPTMLGALCGSSFSSGFPGYVRRFNAAFLSVPALPSTVVPNAADQAEVVARSIPTSKHGIYYLVVNTSMDSVHAKISLPGEGQVRDLLERRTLAEHEIALDLYPGEVRSFRVGGADLR